MITQLGSPSSTVRADTLYSNSPIVQESGIALVDRPTQQVQKSSSLISAVTEWKSERSAVQPPSHWHRCKGSQRSTIPPFTCMMESNKHSMVPEITLCARLGWTPRFSIKISRMYSSTSSSSQLSYKSNSGVRPIEIGIWPGLTTDHAGDSQPV